MDNKLNTNELFIKEDVRENTYSVYSKNDVPTNEKEQRIVIANNIVLSNGVCFTLYCASAHC